VALPVPSFSLLGTEFTFSRLCLQVGDDPVPFGLAAYDRQGNEFDTLDGVQIAWFIGSSKDVAEIKASIRQW
jgi:hypothetical protein